MTKLYFAPINKFGNSAYRHLLLRNGCDYAFSELIMINYLDKVGQQEKFEVIEEDIPRTIFQIGAGQPEEIRKGVELLKERIPCVREINLNCGCPNSGMKAQMICGGILYNQDLLENLAKSLGEECSKHGITPSIKLRLGTSIENIEIKDYLKRISDSGVKKVYIHARPLSYSYHRVAIPELTFDLKKDFPDMELIYNGDVDSYNIVTDILDNNSFDGVMIGRAALSNPLIFRDIKSKTEYFDCEFYPIKKDPNICERGGSHFLGKDKYEAMIDLINIAIEHKIPASRIKHNLPHLLKGISESSRLNKEIFLAESNEKIKELIENNKDKIIF